MNKLVYQYNKNFFYYIIKRTGFSVLTEKFWTNSKLLNLKLIIESELQVLKLFLVNVILKIGQGKYLLLNLFWKLTFGPIKLKI